MAKKVVLFEGKFNPIHNDDVRVIREVMISNKVDEIWVMPCMQNQFDYELLDGDLRVEMIESALFELRDVVSDVKVKVSREELDFPGMSSPYDIIKRLKRKFDYDFIWLGGSDLLYSISKWYRFLEVFEMVEFLIYAKKGFALKDVSGMKIFDVVLEDVPVRISSDEIRLRILEGFSARGMVCPGVENIIRERDCYSKIKLP